MSAKSMDIFSLRDAVLVEHKKFPERQARRGALRATPPRLNPLK